MRGQHLANGSRVDNGRDKNAIKGISIVVVVVVVFLIVVLVVIIVVVVAMAAVKGAMTSKR